MTKKAEDGGKCCKKTKRKEQASAHDICCCKNWSCHGLPNRALAQLLQEHATQHTLKCLPQHVRVHALMWSILMKMYEAQLFFRRHLFWSTMSNTWPWTVLTSTIVRTVLCILGTVDTCSVGRTTEAQAFVQPLTVPEPEVIGSSVF